METDPEPQVDPETRARLERLAARRRDRLPNDEPRTPRRVANAAPPDEPTFPAEELTPAAPSATAPARRSARTERTAAVEAAAAPAPAAPARGESLRRMLPIAAARRHAKPLTASLLAGAMVVAAGGYALDRLEPRAEPGPVDPRRMITIPAARYAIGVAEPASDELTALLANQASFAIDRYEVRNIDYERYLVRHPDASPPNGWVGRAAPNDHPDYPVVGVTHEQAEQYCDVLDKRLPTEAEWEIAARGRASGKYPWGNDLADGDLPNRGAYAVGAVAANHSEFGVMDQIGNAWEWVGTPAEPVGADQQVLRGGSNRSPLTLSQRVAAGTGDLTAVGQAGFRCAADAVSPEYRDDFTDPGSGWPLRDDAALSLAYLPPSTYDLILRRENAKTRVLAGIESTDVTVETSIQLGPDSSAGTIRYGLAFRATGRGSYAFVIDSVANQWQLLVITSKGGKVLAHGVPSMLGGRVAPDTLRVEARGARIDLFFNDEFVDRVVDDTFDRGDSGFYLQTKDADDAEVLVESFAVRTDGAALTEPKTQNG